MSDIAERLDSIRERVEAATEGPWEAGVDRLPEMGGGRVMVRNVERGRKIAECGHETLQQATPNSAFIAASRSDVPYLLSLVEEVGEALAEAKVMWHVADGELYERDDEEAARERADHLGVEVVPVRVIPADNDRIATTLNALRDAAQEGAE